MAFRDYSQQFAPVNVFGGLGKGLGEGLGRGVTKSIRRPLFRKLADKFRTENEAKAQLNTLAQMGLQAAPVEGDTQYPIFQDMMAQNLSVLNQRPDRAQVLWETDPEAAQEYLLGEDKIYAAKGGKGSSKDGEAFSPQVNAAIDKLITTANESYRLGGIMSQDPSKPNQDAYNQAYQNLLTAKGEFYKITGGKKPSDLLDSQSQVMTTLKAANEMHNQITNIAGKKLDMGGKLAMSADKAKALLSARTKALSDDLGEYKKLAEQLKVLIKQFNKNPDAEDNGQLFAQAAKTMGLAVEPGLAVTTSEVDLYSGENWATKILGIVPTIVRAAVGFKDADAAKLEKAEADAANQNPFVLQRMLSQAANAISAGLNAYQGIGKSLAEGISSSAADRVNMQMTFVGDTISEEQKQSIIADTRRMVGSAGVAKDLENYTPDFPAVASPSGSFKEEDPGDIFGTEYSQNTEDSADKGQSLGEAAGEIIQDAAKEATSTSTVLKGMKNGVNQDLSAWGAAYQKGTNP